MKKILTTKPHLVVFFLGMIYWPLIYMMWLRRDIWNQNRMIGWGFDTTNFAFMFSENSFFINVWVLFFPIVYWILRVRKHEFNYVLMVFQVVSILLFFVSTFQFQYYYFSFSLLISIWLLFFANIIAALFSKTK
ncbi:MAG: hypothetical protein AB8F94_02960 [Saprospiraceae bacterium]